MGERRRPLCCARRGSVVARGTHHSSRERVLRGWGVAPTVYQHTSSSLASSPAYLTYQLTYAPRPAPASGPACRAPPGGSTAVESASMEAVSSSTRGSGWAPNGLASPPGSAEPPRTARRAMKRRRRQTRILHRGASEHAGRRSSTRAGP
eukprot:scaffold28661_cov41-Phaeocystis_antarctica.AAC.1